MTRQTLLDTMGAEELQYWIAYDCLKDEEYRKSISHKIYLEKQAQLSEQETQQGLRAFLSSIGKHK